MTINLTTMANILWQALPIITTVFQALIAVVDLRSALHRFHHYRHTARAIRCVGHEVSRATNVDIVHIVQGRQETDVIILVMRSAPGNEHARP